jgi:lipopolysaccharide export system protein LptA
VKRKVLIATAAVCAIAMIPQIRGVFMHSAYAQVAAVTASPAVVEMPPPSGEVLPPAASTIMAAPDSSAATPPIAHPAAAGHVKPASISRGRKDSKAANDDSPSDSSPFGGFESSSNHGPTNINSDTMSFDYKKNAVLFSGHVHAVQGGNELSSDTLHVQMNKDRQIQEMIADGNVRLSQGQRWTTSDHAVLDQALHTLVLTGSPVAHDGKDQIAGTKITVFLQTNTSEVTNPKAVIFPRESKKPNNSEASATVPAQAGADE